MIESPDRSRSITAVVPDEPEEFSVRSWPDWSFRGEPLDGQRRRGRRAVAVVAIANLSSLFLIARFAGVAGGDHDPVRAGVVLGLVVCYGVGCQLVPWYGPRASHRQRIAIVAAVFVLGAAPAVLLGSPDYLTDLTYAVAAGLMLLPLRYSLLLGLATVIGQIGWMQLAEGRVNWALVATLAGVTAALGTVFALVFTIGHLRAARAQVRRLAVDQERERVARDLHDVLGHTLSTMTVKLGLTRRILESGGDTAPAVTEVGELESLCRQALSDVRATVSDYRTVSLTTEIAGARMALRAAGVRADLPATADDVLPGLHGVFGYVVREAVTNVLRHSDAGRCRIRLGRDWVEITDDGTAAAATVAGHGLTGLAERLDAVSGALEHGRAPGGGFRVLARAPAPRPADGTGPA
ncbi:sensor histidine kinase [Amycolatopsis saalfeldensis]|uniref:Two-component system, NarL family, sensor histidine kinase DesK n=1 Tax=Amycolatopsis saalfeldensis TaxID=394193 RepID=A0A1H8SK50_9PSEU|nr:histidine kinase [Amycolatopsis saalfeldensis]SEO79062.1 two-component system, NarL family, sensor histidine kinase DesK [Amycolatopsis saalfeldensis]